MDEIKAVIVVAPELPRGLAANRTAVLATGLAAHVPNLIGKNLTTRDGRSLLGFTQVPIPILMGHAGESLLALAEKSTELGLVTLVFLTRAQGMRSYDEYITSVAQTNYVDLDVDAIALYGDRKLVTKVTGNLPSLR